MNKLTKIGASALCGSLAAISAANAGSLSVTGGVDMSWISLDDESTGNPIGIGSNLTFAGSGELDNGWTVALSVAHLNGNGYSNTNVTVTVPSIGDFRISQGVSGAGICRMDDLTPNVWEEAWGTGLGTGIDKVAGASGAANVEWTPNILPDGLTARLAWAPSATGSKSADLVSSGVQAGAVAEGSGYDITITASDAMTGMSGLTLYGGYSSISQDAAGSTVSGDKEEQTLGIKYAVGGFTLGYQWSEEDLGLSSGVDKYTNDGYGVTFNINDDLSIGYNNYESEQSNIGGTSTSAEASSIQLAYTMGGATIRIAEADIDNAKYQTGASNQRDATTISVSLAF
jgi:outer membrane protein OmpU